MVIRVSFWGRGGGGMTLHDTATGILITIIIIVLVFVITTTIHKVKYDRPGECSPEKDCLR